MLDQVSLGRPLKKSRRTVVGLRHTTSRNMAHELPGVALVAASVQLDLRVAQIRRNRTARKENRASLWKSVHKLSY